MTEFIYQSIEKSVEILIIFFFVTTFIRIAQIQASKNGFVQNNYTYPTVLKILAIIGAIIIISTCLIFIFIPENQTRTGLLIIALVFAIFDIPLLLKVFDCVAVGDEELVVSYIYRKSKRIKFSDITTIEYDKQFDRYVIKTQSNKVHIDSLLTGKEQVLDTLCEKTNLTIFNR